AYQYVVYFLDWFSKKYAAPGSNIQYPGSTTVVVGDGVCNQTLTPNACRGTPVESCLNDPQDCGPCPTIDNITDSNIATGSCNTGLCSAGVCSTTACGNATGCQFNCESAHYGGTGAAGTVQSDAVDFLVDANSCSAIATLS